MLKKLIFCIVVISYGVQTCLSQNTKNYSWDNEFLGSSAEVPFFPDGNANYWTYTFKNKTELVYKISGIKPTVRYLSYNLYNDKNRTSISSLLDNDFLSDDKTYEIYIAPEGYKDTPKNRTLYYNRNGRYSSLFLRYYLPKADNYGGVPLPEISAFDLKTKSSVSLPHTKHNRLNRRLLLKIFLFYISNNIEKKYYLCKTEEINSIKVSGRGFYEDKNNSYLLIPIKRNENEVAILRFRPPSYSKSRLDSLTNVRYWSLSQVNKKTNNYFTMHDEEFKIAEDGFLYIIISDSLPSDLDSNYNFMNWWTPEKKEMLLLYRNLVPSPSFQYSLESIPDNEIAKKYIGDYAPSGLIITKERFNKYKFNDIQIK